MTLRERKIDLAKKLVVIRKDEDFISGVLARMDNLENLDKLLSYMESGNRNDEEITVASIQISRGLV